MGCGTLTPAKTDESLWGKPCERTEVLASATESGWASSQAVAAAAGAR